jgi:hypothetical protein
MRNILLFIFALPVPALPQTIARYVLLVLHPDFVPADLFLEVAHLLFPEFLHDLLLLPGVEELPVGGADFLLVDLELLL